MRCNAHGAPESCTRSLCQLLGSVDFETGGEETKVRLWWHEHWQTRYSSKEAEEEVTMPTQTPRVQQVRAKIASSPHHLRQPRPPPPWVFPEERSRHAARIRSCTLQRFSPPFPTPAPLTTPTTVVGLGRMSGKQVELIAIATLGLLGWDSIRREGGRAGASSTLCALVNVTERAK